MTRHQRNRLARLARRVEIEGRLVAAHLPEEKHGTPSSYANWGCRCVSCTTAAVAYEREWSKGYRPSYQRRAA